MLTLPALRLELDDDLVPSELVKIDLPGENVANYEAHWDLLWGCYGGSYANRTYLNISGSFGLGEWNGAFLDNHIGPWNSTNENDLEIGLPFERQQDQADNPFGCRSIASVSGHISNSGENYLTIFVCKQKIQQVDTTIAYLGDPRNGGISISQLPVTDESTTRHLTNGTEGIDAFNYRIQADIDAGFIRADPVLCDEPSMNKFFSRIVCGPEGINGTGIPGPYLFGPENVPRLLEAIQSLYKGYMVHVINRKFRQPLETFSQSSLHSRSSKIGSGTGTVTREVERLTINYPSKLTLQIALATMVILSAIAFRLAKLRGTLPRNPCSIASTMGFLAGSELCSSGDILPEGTEWMSRDKLRKSLEGYLFSLGWWSREAKATGSEPRSDSMDIYEDVTLQPRAGMSTETRI